MKMRPYQQQAHDNCILWCLKNTASCVLELPTGAGKSIIVAEIASTLNKTRFVYCAKQRIAGAKCR